MHARDRLLLLASLTTAALGCSANPGGFGDKDSGLRNDAGVLIDDAGNPIIQDDASFNPGDGASNGGDAGGVSVIYAHTDTELYTMDPNTQSIKDVGAFSDGTTSTPVITDLAVNQAGDVWVCSESAIYTAKVPASPGTVSITKVADIALLTGQKFYALGFAPAGALDSGETLVAGDNKGELYAIATNGSTTDLGNFGTNGSGGTYELSGDVVFYTQNSKPRGLATVRLYQSGTTSNDDILAEIDMAAMLTAYNTKTPGNLKKQFLGGGTGFGDLFGVGAWNNSVYAFSRAHTVNTQKVPAQLIQIGASGVGTSLQTFSSITAGFSGAGVTTSAPVTVLPPN